MFLDIVCCVVIVLGSLHFNTRNKGRPRCSCTLVLRTCLPAFFASLSPPVRFFFFLTAVSYEVQDFPFGVYYRRQRRDARRKTGSSTSSSYAVKYMRECRSTGKSALCFTVSAISYEKKLGYKIRGSNFEYLRELAALSGEHHPKINLTDFD